MIHFLDALPFPGATSPLVGSNAFDGGQLVLPPPEQS
jgi:hypothetical protein